MLRLAIICLAIHSANAQCPPFSTLIGGTCSANAGYYAVPVTTNLLRTCAGGRCPTMSNLESPTWNTVSDAGCTTWGASCLINDNTLAWNYMYAGGATEYWLAVDMLATYTIASVVITSRNDCCYTGSKHVEIWVGNNPVYNGQGNTLCYSDSTGTLFTNINQVVTVQCASAVTGRYVTVHKTMTGVSPKNEFVISDLKAFPAPAANILKCPAGTYSAQGATSCTLCGVVNGATCGLGGTFQSYSAEGSSACSPYCNAGYKVGYGASANGCFACPAGQYMDISHSAITACKDCAAGTYSSSTGVSQCSYCAAGTYQGSAGSSACIQSPVGYYSLAGATQPTSCPYGSISTIVGATACTLCSPGTYRGPSGFNTVCDACMGGYRCPNYGMDDSHLYPCLATGQYSPPGATACSMCPSNAITTSYHTGCSTCPVGKAPDGARTTCVTGTVPATTPPP